MQPSSGYAARSCGPATRMAAGQRFRRGVRRRPRAARRNATCNGPDASSSDAAAHERHRVLGPQVAGVEPCGCARIKQHAIVALPVLQNAVNAHGPIAGIARSSSMMGRTPVSARRGTDWAGNPLPALGNRRESSSRYYSCCVVLLQPAPLRTSYGSSARFDSQTPRPNEG